MTANAELGVACCYFNPCNYESKYNNFIKFYTKLYTQVNKIVVVEIIYPFSKTQLPSYIDSLKIYCDKPFWHKENAINIGIKNLIDLNYSYVAWLDADIVFEDSSWVSKAINKLKTNVICQLFSSAVALDSFGCEKKYQGCVSYWSETGNILPANTSFSTGYAWAAKSTLFKDIMLYDKCIIGGADSLLWLAFFYSSRFNNLLKKHPFNYLDIDIFLQDYLFWAKKWGFLIGGNFGFVDTEITVLNHGSSSDRQYASRYHHLSIHKYNPAVDTFYDKDILYVSNKKLLRSIFNYFKSRKEDGNSFMLNFRKKVESLKSFMTLMSIDKKL